MSKIKAKDFEVDRGSALKLDKWPTLRDPFYKSKKDYKHALHSQIEDLSAQQDMLFAGARHGVLLILQAMDAAGKDGIVKHVMSGINPQGCEVFDYKKPAPMDVRHDFLWRTYKDLPPRGRIGIFNRSYYEEVIVTRVHPELLSAEGVPSAPAHEENLWNDRFHSIRNFEKHLSRNGNTIIKIFLHLSKDEQRRRFIDRIDQVEKNWKLTTEDIQERAYWETYMRAYEECMAETSIKESPWYIVPADDKENARLIVSQILLDRLHSLDLSYPKVSRERKNELLLIRKDLALKSSQRSASSTESF